MRLEASLLRTLLILREFQIQICPRYIRNRNADDEAYYANDPNDDCLNEMLEDLLVDYDDLKTIIAFFEKAYGELFNKLQKF